MTICAIVLAATLPVFDYATNSIAVRIAGADPAFLLIGDEAILRYCLSTGGVGKGPLAFYHRKEIQAAMDELCPGYKLEAFDVAKCEERVRTETRGDRDARGQTPGT